MNTQRIITSEEEAQISDLFEKVTVPIPGIAPDIRAINLDSFKLGVTKMMEIADLKGKLEALEVSIETIRSTRTSAI
jgi:hypothetical protein